MYKNLIYILSIVSFFSCAPKNPHVRQIGTTPDVDSCYAQGVSGAYSGLIDGHLILAGGANFPYKPAADGGVKRYYDAIYASTAKLDVATWGSDRHPKIEWQQVGVLPAPMAYGVTITDDEGMVVVGGCNTRGGVDLAFRIKHQGSGLRIEQLPSLPYAIDNMAGASLGNRIYIVGGLQNGQPSSAMYAYDFNYGEWFECAPLPSPRVQPVCAAQGGKLYVWGGYVQPVDSLGRVQGDACVVYSDGYVYDPQTNTWMPVAAPTNAEGHPLTLSGGAAAAWGDDAIIAVGGVNRNVFLGGIQGIFPMPDYLLHEPSWYRFNPSVLVYSTTTGSWRQLTESELTARAGASLVVLPSSEGTKIDSNVPSPSRMALVVGGEIKPGIRSQEVTRISE